MSSQISTSSSPNHKADATIKLDQISVEGRARLLDMAFSRLKFGLFAMPIVSGVLAWYYYQPGADARVTAWSLCYALGAVAAFFINRRYQKNLQAWSADDILNVWLPRVEFMALLHGVGLMVVLPMVSHTASLEFKYLYILTVAAIMAGNATHQAPMHSVFNHFLAAGWHCTVLLMPWSFYDHWYFIMPLSAIYSVGMYRHSLASHHFFVRMIWLEEEGARLAESYKSAKDEAEAALHAKNQFLTTASHDLRQPVHAMGFLIESILRRNKDEAIQPALNDLKQSVRSVTQMFNSLLDLSKIETGNVALNTSNIALDALIQEVITTFSEEARAKNLTMRTKLSGGAAVAQADRTLLHQSMMNLMHNALRYTKHGGVLIAVRKRRSAWQLDIWDTGVGIAQQDQAHIYSPFFRNEHAWQIDSAGHGLGLAVVSRCCEIMGCQYGFHSRLNRGSHFWLRLPASTIAPQAIPVVNAVKPQLQAPQEPMQLSGTCLIVDDDPQVIAAWELLLSAWGVTVKCVDSGKQALMALEDGFTPQVIFCDQRLRAGESGFEVLQALLARNPNAHGAMISGEFNSPELLDAENEGYLVLHKPLEPEQLFTVLFRWLS